MTTQNFNIPATVADSDTVKAKVYADQAAGSAASALTSANNAIDSINKSKTSELAAAISASEAAAVLASAGITGESVIIAVDAATLASTAANNAITAKEVAQTAANESLANINNSVHAMSILFSSASENVIRATVEGTTTANTYPPAYTSGNDIVINVTLPIPNMQKRLKSINIFIIGTDSETIVITRGALTDTTRYWVKDSTILAVISGGGSAFYKYRIDIEYYDKFQTCLIIADSIGQGYGASEYGVVQNPPVSGFQRSDGSYRYVLKDYLTVPYWQNGWFNKLNIPGTFFINRSVGGSTCADWVNTYLPAKRHLLDQSSLVPTYTMLMCGGNDIAGSHTAQATVQIQFISMINTVVATGSIPIVVLYPTFDDNCPTTPTPETVIASYRNWQRSYCTANNIRCLDLSKTALIKPLGYGDLNYTGVGVPGSDYADGMHNNDPGYDKIWREAQKQAYSLLGYIPTSSSSDSDNSATIALGNVTTGAPGSDVLITNSGTSSAAVFNFRFPAGTPGATGDVSNSNVTADPAISTGFSLTGTVTQMFSWVTKRFAEATGVAWGVACPSSIKALWEQPDNKNLFIPVGYLYSPKIYADRNRTITKVFVDCHGETPTSLVVTLYHNGVLIYTSSAITSTAPSFTVSLTLTGDQSIQAFVSNTTGLTKGVGVALKVVNT